MANAWHIAVQAKKVLLFQYGGQFHSLFCRHVKHPVTALYSYVDCFSTLQLLVAYDKLLTLDMVMDFFFPLLTDP